MTSVGKGGRGLIAAGTGLIVSPRENGGRLASEGRFKLLGAVFQPRDHQERAQDEKLPRPLPSRASKRRPPKF